jgi:hypothetical protein
MTRGALLGRKTALAEVVSAPRGGYVSGPRLEPFRLGWATPIVHNNRAHYFVHDEDGLARAACGHRVVRMAQLYEPGNFPQCKRCLRRAAWMNAK